MTLFGIPMCQETLEEQWCGSFGGACLAKVLGGDGLPVEPEQLEPAMCAMTKSICGTEADMKAELTPEAVGLEVVATIPCPPTSGLPNTSMCNVVTGPGIDAETLQPKLIDPPMQLTARAQRRMDEKLAEGEAMIYMMTTVPIVFGVFFGTVCLVLCLMCCRRAHRGRGENYGDAHGACDHENQQPPKLLGAAVRVAEKEAVCCECLEEGDAVNAVRCMKVKSCGEGGGDEVIP